MISNNIINEIGKDKFIQDNYDSILLYPTYLF